MLNVVVSGNLAADVEASRNPDWLKVRIGSNASKKNRDGEYEKVVTWCVGVVNANHVKTIRTRLVKGAYVVAAVQDAHVDTYKPKDGDVKVTLQLGIIRLLEVGKSPADQAPAPVQPQYQQPPAAPAAYPQAQPLYQPAPAPAPQPVEPPPMYDLPY